MTEQNKGVPKPRPPRSMLHTASSCEPASREPRLYETRTYESKQTYELKHDRELPVANETSAGGVIVKIVNGEAYIAVIARRNRAGRLEWCLPKGHLEGAETAAEAAVREISEETGIYGRALLHLSTIDYWFSGHKHRIHKVVHHFLLEALSGTITVENDPDHEAEKAEWVPITSVGARLAYPNERKIVNMANSILRGTSA